MKEWLIRHTVWIWLDIKKERKLFLWEEILKIVTETVPCYLQ